MKIPYFGEINLESLEDYYQVIIDFEGRKLKLDLNFKNTSINEGKLSQVTTILENLEKSVEKAKKFINQEFQTGSEVDDYIEFQ